MKLMKDRRGFTILILGFIAAMVIGVVDFASDTITPVMEEIGMVGEANVSEAATYSVGVIDTFVQSLPWLIAFLYLGALVFSIVFVVSYSHNPNPAFIGVYFALIILLIFGAIIISNAYEDIYTGTDEIATRLQDQTALSYMILYSPFILALIAFIAGIYLFAGRQGEGGGYPV